jgi:DNA-binding NarL/FixJ family response regulator
MDISIATSRGSDVERRATVLVAARPDRMRDSLELLLRTIPGMEIVGQTDNGPSALRIVAEERPSLAVVDTNLSDGSALTLLRPIKAREPRTRRLVLVDNGQKQKDAATAGAGAVLRKGFPAEELFDAVERLLPGWSK